MSIVLASEVGISQSNDGVKFRIGGRTHNMSGRDALLVSNRLGNAAADNLKVPDGLPVIGEVHLRPFDKRGVALLRISTSNGPATFAIDHDWLKALAAAAEAALELSSTAGTA